MIKVTIHSTEVRTMSGVSKTSGKPYNMAFQEGWMHLYDRAGKPDPHPTRVELTLEHGQDGAALFYPLGEYTLHPSSIYVGRDGRLAITPRLLKTAAPARAAA